MQIDLICKICKKSFNHLGSHLWHGHKILARNYKSQFELPYNIALVSEQIRIKQHKANLKHQKQNCKNLLSAGNKYRFKKGRTGQRRISEYERKIIISRILKVNKKHKELQICPVCKLGYNHLESHMYKAHKLLSVKNLKSKSCYSLK